jgi:hypothetical protein
MQMNYKIILFFIFFIILTLVSNSKYNGLADAQAAAGAPTTANVSIAGNYGPITVSCVPVSFGGAVFSTSNTFPKTDGCGPNNKTITISLDKSTTNEYWNLYMNATDLTDNYGHSINITPDGNYPYILQVNTTCGPGPNNQPRVASGYKTLLYNFTPICGPDPNQRFTPTDTPLVEFYITIRSGTANSSTSSAVLWGYPNASYTGDFCIFVNGSGANNQTWCGRTSVGINGTNVSVQVTRDTGWGLAPISFGNGASLTPSLIPYNASDWIGFPTNITNGIKTNVLVDLYINGTDLNRTTGPLTGYTTVIDSSNVTYTNSTDPTRTPISNKNPPYWNVTFRKLNHTLPINPTDGRPWGGGDFPNWHNIINNTNIYSWWNISLPPLTPPLASGTYVANITEKIVPSGESPPT